jgi:hypothetical protein
MRCLVTFLLLVGSAVAAPPVRLIPESEEQEILAMMPPVLDKDVEAILSADDLIWYSEIEMPQAYQFENAFHTPYHNISDRQQQPDRVGNANREFPWSHAGGADKVKNLEVFRFVKFPKQDDRYLPMIYFRQRPPGVDIGDGAPGQGRSTWRWMYPRGTVFGELMCMVGPDKLIYPFELRLRTREQDSWTMNALRPFPDATGLANRIKRLRPDWEQAPDLVKLVRHLEVVNKDYPSATIADTSLTSPRHTGVQAFRATVHIDALPPVKDDKLVSDLLLTTPWKSAIAAIWREGYDGGAVHAPTVEEGAGFHIVPENYRGYAFSVDDASCMQCHQHTNMTARTFDRQRGWWGRVRGDDAIFSFHPIDPKTISTNGQNRTARVRQSFVEAGILTGYDARRHRPPLYQAISR